MGGTSGEFRSGGVIGRIVVICEEGALLGFPEEDPKEDDADEIGENSASGEGKNDGDGEDEKGDEPEGAMFFFFWVEEKRQIEKSIHEEVSAEVVEVDERRAFEDPPVGKLRMVESDEGIGHAKNGLKEG